MSVATYGPVRFQIQKTEHLSFGPVKTEDGVDYLLTEIDLAFTAVVNPFALATRGAGNIATPAATPPFQEDAPAQANGDSLGVTLRNLRAMLLTPRQTLTFSINNDQVVNITGPDSRQGPQPQKDTYVRWIIGTRTALVYFHVKAWTVDLLPSITGQPTPARKVVLANRYRVMSTTDENWYSRRHIQGQMVIDPSQLIPLAADGVLTPDNFRIGAFLSIPTGFKRENIQVVVSSDNTTLDYSYVDQEQPLAYGARSLATKIEGSVSCGITSPLLNAQGMTALVVGAAQLAGQGVEKLTSQPSSGGFWNNMWAGFKDGLFSPNTIAGPPSTTFPTLAAAALGLGLPKVVGTGIVRITGQRNAFKQDLITLGINILLDRFFASSGAFAAYFTQNNAPRVGRIVVMQDITERVVEVTAEFIPTFTTMFNAATNIYATALTLTNNQTDINLSGTPGQLPGTPSIAPNANAGPILIGAITGVNPPPPFSGGTRGDWLGALVVSLLGTPGETPVNAPADPAINIDTPFL